jgi:MscS family membrane protein
MWDTIYERILQNPFLYITAIVICLILLIWILVFIFRSVVNRFVLKQYIKREPGIQKTEGVFLIIIFLIGLDVALQRLPWEDDVVFKILRSLLVVVITIFVAELATVLLDLWGKHMGAKKGREFQEEILPLTQSTVRVLLFLIALVIILELWGVQIWTLLASIGVVGIIIGLALNDSLKNVFGGIALIIDRTFHAGDLIQLDNGDLGEVVMINLRSTRVLTYDQKIVSIPNSVLANTKITNFSQPTNLIRVYSTFSVAYGTDLNKVENTVKASIKGISGLLETPPAEVRLIKMNEYALDFKLDVFIRFQSIKHLEDTKDELIRVIYGALSKKGIVIPYPTSVSVRLSEQQIKTEKKKGFLRGKFD